MLVRRRRIESTVITTDPADSNAGVHNRFDYCGTTAVVAIEIAGVYPIEKDTIPIPKWEGLIIEEEVDLEEAMEEDSEVETPAVTIIIISKRSLNHPHQPNLN